MRKNHRAIDVIMAVHRVDAVKQRDFEPAETGVLLEAVVEVGPGFEAVALFGIGSAAAQNRAQEVTFDIGGMFDAGAIGLRDFPDFFRRASYAPAAA